MWQICGTISFKDWVQEQDLPHESDTLGITCLQEKQARELERQSEQLEKLQLDKEGRKPPI